MKKTIALFVAAASLAFASPASAQTAYSDVPTGHWADAPVRYVAEVNDWLRVPGRSFYPNRAVTRGLFARALVKAFAPNEHPSDAIQLSDVLPTSSFYVPANVAVKRGWLTKSGTKFNPSGTVSKAVMDRALARALGLSAEIRGISAIATEDGYRFKHPSQLAYGVIASQLGFHFNYPNAMRRELQPSTPVSRADVAKALRAATTAGRSWRLNNLQRYREITLPRMSAVRKRMVEYALRYAEHPYIYAGQSSAGFDCSGFVWWVLRAGMGNAAARGYNGWSIPQRASYDMARATSRKIDPTRLLPGDLLFWATDGGPTDQWRSVGHAGIYLGNGWFIHSSGSRAGVSIDRMTDGYWNETFVWGRRVIPTKA